MRTMICRLLGHAVPQYDEEKCAALAARIKDSAHCSLSWWPYGAQLENQSERSVNYLPPVLGSGTITISLSLFLPCVRETKPQVYIFRCRVFSLTDEWHVHQRVWINQPFEKWHLPVLVGQTEASALVYISLVLVSTPTPSLTVTIYM